MRNVLTIVIVLFGAILCVHGQPIVENVPNAPSCTELTLYPCQPTLVRDTVHLQFCLPDSGQTQVLVRNVLGQLARTVVDSVLRADQYHVTMPVHELESGIYFVQLCCQNRTKTVKFHINKQ